MTDIKNINLKMRPAKIICLIFFLCFSIQLQAKEWSIAELKANFGLYKKFTPETQLPALLALSYFPELKNVPIKFEYKNIRTTMATRPNVVKSLFVQRSYIIYINADATSIGSVSFQELNLTQQLGIIAHELAHIADYEKRSTFSLMICGGYYAISKTYHKKLERRTDAMVIEHGLADPLHAFSYYVLNESKASDEYKAFKRSNYMLPEEILNYKSEQKP